MSNNDSILNQVKEIVLVRLSLPSTASKYFGPPVFCAGAAFAAHTATNLKPTLSLVFGTIGMINLSRFVCSVGNGEHALLRSFAAGFVCSGVFRYYFF
jgi:uncharacterized membrane protein HdeD (DUF308 family)